MDWKDILAQKVNSGELEREEFVNEEAPAIKKPDVIEVSVDRKGRKGKTATIAAGFTCDDEELKSIASQLKTRLSTGGSARGGEILLQGERAEEMKKILRDLGYKVK